MRGDQTVREGVAERGQGSGGKRGGTRGWCKRGGVRGARGWNLYFNKVFKKTA